MPPIKFDAKQWAKTAQYFGGNPMRGPTLTDLYNAIRADAALGFQEKAQIINQVKGMTGYASDGTALQALMAKGLGGTIGWLISKYFGMGAVGQLVSSLAGYGIGSMINNHINQPPDPLAGSMFRTVR